VTRKDPLKPEMRTYAIESYQVFRSGVQPFTEWPSKSSRATKFVYRSCTEFQNEELRKWDNLWEQAVLLCIGESLPGSGKLNGIGVTDKGVAGSTFRINIDVWCKEEAGDFVRALNEKLGDVAEKAVMRCSSINLHKDYTAS